MQRNRALIKYTATRIMLAPIMLWIIATMIFLLLRVAPGDPVDAILGNRGDSIAKAALRERLGLDKSLLNQYLDFINSLAHGDLGLGLINQEPVVKVIMKSLPATVELGIVSLLIAILLGALVGLLGAFKPNGNIDLAGRLYGISTYALPPFWAAMVFQLIFAVWLGWLPIGGRFPPNLIAPDNTGFLIFDCFISGDWIALQGALRHIILPASTLGILLSGIFSRALRLNLIQTINKDFIEAARARGIKESRIIFRHAIPNTLIPVLTITGITIASLIGGALLIEVTFSWPGIALRLQEAINQRDYPVVQGIVVIISTLIVFISVSIDLIIAFIDPRIRY